jgi:peptide/nickel transport system permease protein
MLGVVSLSLIVGAAVFAPVIAPRDPYRQDLTKGLLPPVWVSGGTLDHPLGTDTLGRDVASRLLHGARNSLAIAALAVLVAGVLGVVAGLWAGFSRGAWDPILMRLGDMQLAFPFILIAIIILGVITDRTIWHLVLVLGIPGWILYARVVRSRVLAERDKEYVAAARSIGASQLRQLRRYLLPSVWQVVVVIALLDLGFIILVESTLSFVGFGLTQPAPSWGSILAEGRKNMLIAPWLAVIPGVAIMLTVLSINLVADGAADILDPRLKRGLSRRTRRAPPAATAVHAPGSAIAVPEAPAATASLAGAPPLLEVRDLHVEFAQGDRTIQAVRGVSLTVDRGETVGIVGESGSGKSVTALAVIGLLDGTARVTRGAVLLDGRDLLRATEREVAAVRGSRIGMIFQNPSSSLDPVMRAGDQMVEAIRQHTACSATQARALAAGALREVGIGDPIGVMTRYPFQLSGGMNQRIMIAMAMLARPDVLIADEPTTALDVTTQAQVLERLTAIAAEHRTALLFISHDIALLSEHVDRLVVLYAGRVCETGPVEAVIRAPAHPYTEALLGALPRPEVTSDERLVAIAGEPPDPGDPEPGCPFAGRCRYAMEVCREIDPPLLTIAPDRAAACHLGSLPDGPAPLVAPGAVVP